MYPFRTRAETGVDILEDRNPAFAGLLREPSDGLEPSTPSLPFRFWGGERGHARAFPATKVPQTGGIRRRDVTRAWTRVVLLVFAPRSHGAQRDVEAIKWGRMRSASCSGVRPPLSSMIHSAS